MHAEILALVDGNLEELCEAAKISDILQLDTKLSMFQEAITALMYLESLDDECLWKEYKSEIEKGTSLDLSSFKQTDKDTFLRLKLRSIETSLQDIKQQDTSDQALKDKVSNIEGMVTQLCQLLSGKLT